MVSHLCGGSVSAGGRRVRFVSCVLPHRIGSTTLPSSDGRLRCPGDPGASIVSSNLTTRAMGFELPSRCPPPASQGRTSFTVFRRVNALPIYQSRGRSGVSESLIFADFSTSDRFEAGSPTRPSSSQLPLNAENPHGNSGFPFSCRVRNESRLTVWLKRTRASHERENRLGPHRGTKC